MSGTLNIVADQQITLAAEVFEQFGHLTLLNGRDITPQSLQQADVLLVRSVTRVNADLLRDSPIRFVGSATAGIDHIDEEWLAENNIAFAYAPGSNARAVAEYVLSALLYLEQRDGFDLTAKAIGIIGVGEVGSRVRQMMEHLGVHCLLNDPPRAEVEIDHTDHWQSLNQLASADVITCHVPLTETGPHSTKGLINKDFLQQLSPDAIIINTSRGGVIDENELKAFKTARPASHLVIDVWDNEPLINKELAELSTLATPHIAGYSYDGKRKATIQLAAALQSYLEVEPVKIESDNKLHDVEILPSNHVLFNAVKTACDVERDSNELKQSLSLPHQQRAEMFDTLRKTYRRRREFDQTRIDAPHLLEQDKRRLLQLGFEVS